MTLAEFQKLIRERYFETDSARGAPATFLWFAEEVGELAEAIREGDREAQVLEFSDVLAWLATLANLCDVELSDAIRRYAEGCPRCASTPCSCPVR